MKATTLTAPQRPLNLPEEAVWLAGEGAGSWFEWQIAKKDLVRISRYSPQGGLECNGLFQGAFDITVPFSFTYPSHCQMITLLQKGMIITLSRVMDMQL